MPFATPYADTLAKGGAVANQGADVANSMMAGIQKAMSSQSDLAFKMQKLVQDDKYRKAQQELKSQELMQQALQFKIKQKFAEDTQASLNKSREAAQNIAVANLGMASDKALREAEEWNIKKPALKATADATVDVLNKQNNTIPSSLDVAKPVDPIDPQTFNTLYKPISDKLDIAEQNLSQKYDQTVDAGEYVKSLDNINQVREDAQYRISKTLDNNRQIVQAQHNLDIARNNLYSLEGQIEARKSLKLPADPDLVSKYKKLEAIVSSADAKIKNQNKLRLDIAKEIGKTDPAGAMYFQKYGILPQGSTSGNVILKNQSGKTLHNTDGSPAINYTKIFSDDNVDQSHKVKVAAEGIVNFTTMNKDGQKNLAVALSQTDPVTGIATMSQMLNNTKYKESTSIFLSNMRKHHPAEYAAFKANFEQSSAPTYQKKQINEYEIAADALMTMAKTPGGSVDIENMPNGSLKNKVKALNPSVFVDMYKSINELNDTTKLMTGVSDAKIKESGYNQVISSAATGSDVNVDVLLSFQSDKNHMGPIDLTQPWNFTVTDNQLKINKENAFEQFQDNKGLNYILGGTIDNPASKKALAEVKSISDKIRSAKNTNKTIGPAGYKVTKSPGKKVDTKKLYKQYNKAISEYFKTLKASQKTLEEYTNRKTHLWELFNQSLTSDDVQLVSNGKPIMIPKKDIKSALYFLVGSELTQKGL